MGASVASRELEQYLGVSEIDKQIWTINLFLLQKFTIIVPYLYHSAGISCSPIWGIRSLRAVNNRFDKGSNARSVLNEEMDGEITSY